MSFVIECLVCKQAGWPADGEDFPICPRCVPNAAVESQQDAAYAAADAHAEREGQGLWRATALAIKASTACIAAVAVLTYLASLTPVDVLLV